MIYLISSVFTICQSTGLGQRVTYQSIMSVHAYQAVSCSNAGWARKTIQVSSGWDFEELKG